MGAFRVLLGSLHYMGLYMQLSVSARQAGHGETENHISGNGRSESRFCTPVVNVPPLIEMTQDGRGDAICSHAERDLNKEQPAG